MAGLGYRRDMSDWDMSQVNADFFEVVPENWVRRDREPLYRLLRSGRPVHLHGVSLNLGGTSDISKDFLHGIRELMDDLGAVYYSDHLAASGDAHQLYDLFPIPFVAAEVIRVSERIKRVQDILGCQIAIENPTWYTNVGDIPEPDFLSEIALKADCGILLDINNIAVNAKNHGLFSLEQFVARVDLARVTYLHVAGHEFDERFGLYIDTHSRGVERDTRAFAMQLNQQHGLPILLEWDNDIPEMSIVQQELQCLHSTIM
jgi:uncharacterized protein (UPF0276 family)